MKYDEYMDKECIEVCDLLNLYPGVKIFESCCGHLKEAYMVFFKCNNFVSLGKLFRCVNRNYSSGQFEILVDGCDTYPCCCFWLRSKEVFKTEEEMNKALEDLKENLKYYLNCSEKLEEYFQTNDGHGFDLMEEKDIIQLCGIIYKNTLGYSLEKIKINDDGTTTHLHSDEFLDEHPERRDNPEFTKEEELEAAEYLAKLAEADYKQFGPLPLKIE